MSEGFDLFVVPDSLVDMRIEARNGGIVSSGGDVGFSRVPDQILRKYLQRGFFFNLLVVGERGSGVKTLLETVYNRPIIERDRRERQDLEEYSVTIKEVDVSLTLNIVLSRVKDPAKILGRITETNERYNRTSVGIIREKKEDLRIHACIYIINPHSFGQSELALIEKMSSLCNVIPIISRADTYLPEEVCAFKKKIHSVLSRTDLYGMADVRERYPLAICGSNTFYTVEGLSFRGRKYPWGLVNTEDEEHFDLKTLRNLLIFRCFIDLQNRTTRKYKAWKKEKAEEQGGAGITKREELLVKQVEEVMARKLEEKRLFLEMEEQKMRRDFQNLMDAIAATEREANGEEAL